MTENNFFDEPKEQSIIKSNIVSKYFFAWAKIILSTVKKRQGGRIGYIDLFAGPGRYDDDTKSTPVMVVEKALKDPDLKNHLVTIFNDKDEKNARSLENTINAIEGVEKLAYKPQVVNEEVGDEIVATFEEKSMIPTFFFVDPWGYKGLSLRLINSVLRNWGSDCVFFFNYNRVNMGINNEAVETHIDALFGKDRARQLREVIKDLSPDKREAEVLDKLAESLREMGGEFVLPFRFEFEDRSRTSHYLIFVTKHFKGYEVMKDVMSKESSSDDQGIFSFAYTPSASIQPRLFRLTDPPLDILKEALLVDFRGRTLTMKEIYREHSVDTPYISKNYKDPLKELEAEDKIVADPPAEERRKNTFANRVMVTFPS